MPKPILSKNFGKKNAHSLGVYIQDGGYEAMKKARALFTCIGLGALIKWFVEGNAGLMSYFKLPALAKIAMRHNLLVLSDEIYARIYYGDGPVAPSIYSIPGMAERTIIINGFSKTYAMDGWRLGWTVASEQLTRAILKVRQYTTVCVNTFIQHGAATALTSSQACVDEMVGEFAKRRAIMLKGLRNIEGLSVAEPLGAFYLFPKSPVADDARFVGLLAEEKILGVPGRGFGMEGYFRLAFCVEDAVISRSAEGFKRAMAKAKSLG